MNTLTQRDAPTSSRVASRLVARVLVGVIVLAGTALSAQASSRSDRASSSVLQFAQAPGASPTAIFPYDDCLHTSTNNIQLFQQLMYRPLYWFGKGSSAALQPALSLALAPKVSRGDRVFTISLKGWRFSNGQVVNAASARFYLNLYRADPYSNCAYNPGFAIPDQLSAVRAAGTTLTLTFSSPQSPSAVLDNYLSQITPLPLTWSRVASGPAPACANGPYGAKSTDAACLLVRSYLATLGTQTSTFTGSFWQSGVDGPWTLTGFTSSGSATFSANPKYSGPDRPRVSTLREVAYSSAASELTDLQHHVLSVGYVEPSLIPTHASSATGARANSPSLATHYALDSITPWGFNDAILNFSSANPNAVLLKQLYIRQALQKGIDQPTLIQGVFNGFAVPSTNPLPPSIPASIAASVANPYPFNLNDAQALLKAHGWALNATTWTCQRPGTSANECGLGIAANRPLTLNVVWASGSATTDAMMRAEVAAWTQIGFQVTVTIDTPNNAMTDCHDAATGDLCYLGGGWSYAPFNFPSGEQLFSSQGVANFGSFSDPTMNTMITQSLVATGSLSAYAKYAAIELPVLFEPNATSLYEIAKNLRGVGGAVLSPVGTFTPEFWSN
jgi:peptide/nickel transport system substrate-binding protein